MTAIVFVGAGSEIPVLFRLTGQYRNPLPNPWPGVNMQPFKTDSSGPQAFYGNLHRIHSERGG
jgi:hypothetical protein